MAANKTLFQDALKRASNAAWDRRWDTAIKEYRRALTEFPDDVSARSGLALALQESNRLEEALAEYKVLARSQSGDPIPLAHVAVLEEKLNRRSDAATTYSALADMYQIDKQMNKAVEAWRKASALDPDRAGPHEKLAAAFTEAGHDGPAAREWLALAKIAQRGGDAERAKECTEKALQLEPDNTQAKFLMNELMGRGASLSAEPGASPVELARRSALSRLASSVLDDKTPWRRGDSGGRAGADVDTLLARAIDAQQRGQNREAIALYQEVIGAGLARPEIQFNLAILYQNTLQHDDAIALLNQTVKTPQLAVASHFALGQSYRAQGKLDNALDHYLQAMKIIDLATVNRSQADQVIRLYESLSEGYRAKGDDANADHFTETLLAFLNQKGWQDKVREVRQHIDTMAKGGTPLSMQEVFEVPESERVIELLRSSEEMLRAGKLNASSDLALQAIEIAPDYLPAHMQLAEVAVSAGRSVEAVDKYDMLAETAEVRHDLPKAISFYRQALKLAPEDVTRRSKLINAYVQSGQLTEALEQYHTVGQALEASGQPQKAIDKYLEGLALAQRAGVVGANVVQLKRELGAAYLKQHDDDRALAIFHEIHAADPEDDHARFYLVELNLRKGRTQEADMALNELLGRYVNTPQYAVAALEALAQEFPVALGVHRKLAQSYAAAGDPDRAVQLLDAAGEQLLTEGKNDQAAILIQDIISLNPPQVNDYRRLLLELREPLAHE